MEGSDLRAGARLFAYEREIILGFFGIVVVVFGVGVNKLIDISVTLPTLAHKDAVIAISSEVDGIKIGRVYEKIETERRFGAVERAIERIERRPQQ